MRIHLLAAKDICGRRGAFGIVLLIGCLNSFGVRAADWPQFLGPDRNGISPDKGLLAAWPKGGPPLLWQRPAGAGFSGPVVSGDRLVLFHRLGDKEVVTCLDAATGKEKWQFDYPTRYRDDFGMDEGPRSTPLLAGNRVYTLGAEGQLHCLDLDNGKKIWQRSVQSDYQVPKGFFGVATSPLIEGNLLLLNIGGKEAGIVAFDKDTGQEAWRATNHEASYSSPVAATFHGQRRVVFFTREGIVVLDPRTGQVSYNKHWRARIQASVNAASPVIADDLIFISASYRTGAILLRVGADRIEELWQNDDAMSNHYNTCIHSDGFLYGFDGRQEHGAKLRCVELKTGKVRWTDTHSGCGSMILAEDHLIILNEHGQLVVVAASPDSYREKARAQVLEGPCRSPIALANGRLYARDGKKLACWNLMK